jgi:tetratricopeptide (TPR) repeat protein
VGHLHLAMGELDLARAHAERALGMRRELYGPGDELVADSLHQLAIVHHRLGQLDRALRLLLDASRISEERFGADHPSSLTYRVARGSVLLDMGRYKEALAILERALAPLERAAGRESSDVMFALMGIGTAHRMLEDYDLARTALERARDLARRLYGAEHVQVARAQLQLGRVFTDARRWKQARAELEPSLALLRTIFGPEHWEVAEAIEDLARVDIESGRPERAIAPLERALAMRGRIQFDPYSIAFTHYELARSLHRSGRAPDRVRHLVEEARRGFEKAGAASEARDMRRWLDAPGMAEPD